MSLQVRMLVGTLVEVGRGRLSPQEVRAILAGERRTEQVVTAPACGLTLERPFYPPGCLAGPLARAESAPQAAALPGWPMPPEAPAVPLGEMAVRAHENLNQNGT